MPEVPKAEVQKTGSPRVGEPQKFCTYPVCRRQGMSETEERTHTYSTDGRHLGDPDDCVKHDRNLSGSDGECQSRDLRFRGCLFIIIIFTYI